LKIVLQKEVEIVHTLVGKVQFAVELKEGFAGVGVKIP
jgi:hypothetical protein